MPKRIYSDEPQQKPKRATYSITVSEWDASAGRFEDKQLEPISRVVFKMANGHEVELKFANDGLELDVRSQGAISLRPVASNMILIGSTK